MKVEVKNIKTITLDEQDIRNAIYDYIYENEGTIIEPGKIKFNTDKPKNITAVIITE